MFSHRFSSFDDDLFFSGHKERMGQLMDFGMPMLTEGRGNASDKRAREGVVANRRSNDPFSNMMRQMQSMMGNLENNMKLDFSTSSPENGHSYVQSSVYSYNNTGGGAPDIYEAHHSNRYAPGGVREERKALRDTRRQLEKMGVGRHIGERGHYVEKSRNMANNEVQEKQDLYGLTEDDIEGYKREWHKKTRNWQHQERENRRNELAAPSKGRKNQQKALEYQRADGRRRH